MQPPHSRKTQVPWPWYTKPITQSFPPLFLTCILEVGQLVDGVGRAPININGCFDAEVFEQLLNVVDADFAYRKQYHRNVSIPCQASLHAQQPLPLTQRINKRSRQTLDVNSNNPQSDRPSTTCTLRLECTNLRQYTRHDLVPVGHHAGHVHGLRDDPVFLKRLRGRVL